MRIEKIKHKVTTNPIEYIDIRFAPEDIIAIYDLIGNSSSPERKKFITKKQDDLCSRMFSQLFDDPEISKLSQQER